MGPPGKPPALPLFTFARWDPFVLCANGNGKWGPRKPLTTTQLEAFDWFEDRRFGLLRLAFVLEYLDGGMLEERWGCFFVIFGPQLLFTNMLFLLVVARAF